MKNEPIGGIILFFHFIILIIKNLIEKKISFPNFPLSLTHTDHILGNAIVNIKELISNPSQSQTLRLQSGMNNKQDMGNLIVEVFI